MAITLAELSDGPLATDDDRTRAARQGLQQEAEAAFRPLPFDAAAARASRPVAASLRRTRRKPHARAFGALIAATALPGCWLRCCHQSLQPPRGDDSACV